MTRLEQLEKKKREIIERHKRERQPIDDEITKERERIKRDKERKKKEKEQQAKKGQQNNLALADIAYKDFVKDSLTIVELNEILKDFLNQK